jgi:hypothetical protein
MSAILTRHPRSSFVFKAASVSFSDNLQRSFEGESGAIHHHGGTTLIVLAATVGPDFGAASRAPSVNRLPAIFTIVGLGSLRAAQFRRRGVSGRPGNPAGPGAPNPLCYRLNRKPCLLAELSKNGQSRATFGRRAKSLPYEAGS